MVFSAVLTMHVAGGVLAIAAGFAALLIRKGARIHRGAGRVFAVSMTVTGVSAAYLGHVTKDINDVVGGIMTAYLIATAWMAARRKDGQAGIFERTAFCFAALGAIASFCVAIETQRNGTSEIGSFPAFIFAGMIAWAAILDLRVVLRGGLSGRQRIARHLWRMGLAMFIATGSFFLGQMNVLPAPLRRIELMAVPVIAVIVLTIVWLVRVRFVGWPKNGQADVVSGAG